ncbi:MAG: WbqC family protein, partial [Desulfosudaceae bacterium]
WLTVPVTYRFPQKINEVKINNHNRWRKKHHQALLTNYRRAPYYKNFTALLERVYGDDWEYLSDLNIFLTEALRRHLGISRPVFRASDLDLNNEDPTGRLIDICRALHADTYLAGAGGENYMDLKQFRDNNINVLIQDFHHPTYPQQFGRFISQLSSIDFLLNCGPTSISEALSANAEKQPEEKATPNHLPD